MKQLKIIKNNFHDSIKIQDSFLPTKIKLQFILTISYPTD